LMIFHGFEVLKLYFYQNYKLKSIHLFNYPQNMMKLFKYLLVFISVTGFAQTQPFQIYTANGKKVSAVKMMNEITKADVVLFGELHNNTIAHYLQVKVAKHIKEKSDKQLIIGAEMFERDQDSILNKFLINKISEQDFEKSMRLWPNY